MPRKRSQIYDVAERAGVSIATVSRVVNGIEKVRPDTVAAVRRAMKELSYVPNEMARSLATASSGMIGFYMSSTSLSIFDNKYPLEVLRGMESVVIESTYSIVIIGDTPDAISGDAEPRYLSLFRKKKIDGLILNGIERSSPRFAHFSALFDEGCPVAYFGKRTTSAGFNVYAGYEDYVYRAFSLFRDRGHSRVLALALDTPVHGHRFEDVAERFCADHSGDIDISVAKLSSRTEKAVLASVLEEEVVRRGCSGIFVELLSFMPTVLGFLSAAGLRVPDDVSIVSVEHYPGDGAAFYPKIDCFHVPAFEMGAAAARLLVAELNGEPRTEDSVLFNPEYIPRESVGPAGVPRAQGSPS